MGAPLRFGPKSVSKRGWTFLVLKKNLAAEMFFIFEISTISDIEIFEPKLKNQPKSGPPKIENSGPRFWGTFVEPSRKISTTVGKYRSRAFRNIQNYQNRSNSAKVMGFQSWVNFWYTFLISKFWKIMIFRFFMKLWKIVKSKMFDFQKSSWKSWFFNILIFQFFKKCFKNLPNFDIP